MPKRLFYEMDEQKRARVTGEVLREFAQFPYNESSTNRIVKNAGISKGSLFKYFKNKKDIYFYILDYIIADFTSFLEGELSNLPRDIFERTAKYAELEFDWYINNPERYLLIEKALIKNDTEIFEETKKRYDLKGNGFYYMLFEDIDSRELKWDKGKLLNVLKWFLKGFNKEFIENMGHDIDINALKGEYLKRLSEYIEILKKGLE